MFLSWMKTITQVDSGLCSRSLGAGVDTKRTGWSRWVRVVAMDKYGRDG